MKNFNETERSCEMTFKNLQSCWHSYTNGKETPILFATDDDMSFVMNVIAQAAFLFIDKVRIIAFTVMNNHLHFILSGTSDSIEDMFSFISRRLTRAFPSSAALAFSHKPIRDLASMRNHIVYVHRNGYVADHNYTPFSYPWGTGTYYHMPQRYGAPFQSISSVANRSMFRSRDVRLPADWQVVSAGTAVSGMGSAPSSAGTAHISPPSFCDIALGMAMFRDAHHYFAAISKNVEAYSEIAVELNDSEFLTDQELFAQVFRIVREKYRLASTKELTGAQRLELARTLRYDYRSSNGQIRRVLGLTQFEVDSLFPLGK